jgi:UDP-2,4-diacetamido-2,4,6-trideoxy-beta-L-altropyranose hydrolase
VDQPLAVFRADASTRIGGGHVHRCIAIAEAFKERGWTCAFATVADSLSAVPALGSAIADVLVLPGEPADEAAAMREHWPDGPALLLVDHYERDIAFERSLLGWGRLLAVLDDLNVQPHAADLVIDPAPRRGEGGAGRGVSGHVLSGPMVAPLRPEWAQWRAQSLKRDRAAPVERIVVSLGSIDAENITAEVMRILARLNLPCEIVVVLGSGAPHRAAIEYLARSDERFRLVVEPPEFARLMARCDIAIGAAGSTSWERCCLGIPSAAILVADNQRRNAAALDAAGASWIVGEAIGRWQAGLSAALDALVSDANRRVAMSRAAAALCDGRGAARIADTVIAMLKAA